MLLRILAFAIFLCPIMLSMPVLAQKMLPDMETKQEKPEDRWKKAQEIFKKLPEDVQEELEAEAELIYRQCGEQSTLSQYHDCACIGVRFLDERVLQGPDISQADLQAQVHKYCVNEESIAGTSYDECLNMGLGMFPITKNLDPEDYCTCYANEMAQAYQQAPLMNSYYIQKTRSSIFEKCAHIEPIRQ